MTAHANVRWTRPVRLIPGVADLAGAAEDRPAARAVWRSVGAF